MPSPTVKPINLLGFQNVCKIYLVLFKEKLSQPISSKNFLEKN